jgi:hypothetical protein
VAVAVGAEVPVIVGVVAELNVALGEEVPDGLGVAVLGWVEVALAVVVDVGDAVSV